MFKKFFKPTQASIWLTLFLCFLGSSVPSLLKIEKIRFNVQYMIFELKQIMAGAAIGFLILCLSCFLGRFIASRFQKN